MRKISLMMGSILNVYLFLSPMVSAKEGSLKIDVHIDDSNDKKEQTYIEQTPELAKLFSETVSQQISQQQQANIQKNQQDNSHIFLMKGQSLNTVSIDELFVEHQQNIDSAKIGVTLSEKVSVLRWQNIVIGCLAFIIMILSVLPLIKRKEMTHD